MSAAPVEPLLAPEEYLARERAAEFKSEYFNGRVYAMTGASRAHVRIVFDLGRALADRLEGGQCEVLVNDMRVRIPATNAYVYPDVLVACQEARVEDETHQDTLLNPTVIVEVLSPSTEAFDRGDKFAHYQSLASLRHYVLVAQHRPRVEVFTRQGRQWLLTTLEGLDGVLELPAVGESVPLAEIYRRVEFPQPSPPPG